MAATNGAMAMDNPIQWTLACLFVGGAVGTLAYSTRLNTARWLNLIERDLADKLRRLRASTANLHTYVVAWLAATGAVFLGFLILLESPIFAVLFSVGLFSVPWYLVRRMAQQGFKSALKKRARNRYGLQHIVHINTLAGMRMDEAQRGGDLGIVDGASVR